MKVIVFTIIGLVITGFLFFGFVGCQRIYAGNEKDGHMDHMKKWVFTKLDLTEQQRVELERIMAPMTAKHDEMKSMRQELKTALLNELRKDHVYPEALKEILELKRPIIEEMLDMTVDCVASIHAILTPEQRAKLIASIESYHERGHCHWRH